MTSIVVGFIVVLSIAFAVIVSIALPHLREGTPVLTDRGDRLSRRVSRRVDAVARVVGDTLTGLVAGVGGRSAEQHRTHPQPRSR